MSKGIEVFDSEEAYKLEQELKTVHQKEQEILEALRELRSKEIRIRDKIDCLYSCITSNDSQIATVIRSLREGPSSVDDIKNLDLSTRAYNVLVRYAHTETISGLLSCPKRSIYIRNMGPKLREEIRMKMMAKGYPVDIPALE